MTTDETFRLLSQAAGEGLSEFDFDIPSSTEESILEELLGSGYLSMVAVDELGSPAYTGYRITLKGEALLRKLREDRHRATLKGRLKFSGAWLGSKFTTIVVSVVSSVIAAWVVTRCLLR